jgi:hypothetical protein
MSEETRTVVIDVDPGLLIGSVFVPRGKSAAVPKSRADVLVKDKHATDATGQTPDFADLHPAPTEKQAAAQLAKEDARNNAPTSELMDWPAYTQLNMGGILTVEQLRTYRAENGTLWAKKLSLTDEDAIAVESELEKLETPEPPKKKKAPKAEPADE